MHAVGEAVHLGRDLGVNVVGKKLFGWVERFKRLLPRTLKSVRGSARENSL